MRVINPLPSILALLTVVWCSAPALAAGTPVDSSDDAGARRIRPCLQRIDESRSLGKRSGVLLATVPDPVETVFAREFDSMIEAMVSAGAESGFELDETCFPWDAKDPAERIHESTPGIVVLRSGAQSSCSGSQQCLLVIILIGERPQKGVRQAVVHRALDIAHHLSSTEPVSVVGPTFSSSAESLGLALASWSAQDGGRPTSFVIRSGSTTEPAVATLLQRIGDSSDVSIDFRSLAVSQMDLQSCTWNRLVRDRLGLDVRWPLDSADDPVLRRHPCAPNGSGADNGRVALIVERSAYGRQFEGNGFRIVRFSPHLPQLRAAYELRSNGHDRSTPNGSRPADLNRRNLPLSLSRSVVQRLPFFDGEGTAASQDLILRSTLHRLSRLKVQVVGIAATNVMDKLFLSEMVRDLVPNARLLTFEGDILLSHPRYLRATVGTLVASSNPLAWPTPGAEPNRAVQSQFDFDAAQGVYRAVRELLTGQIDGQRDVWMSVVGRGGLYPLARITLSDTLEGRASAASDENAVSAAPRFGVDDRLPRAWLLLVIVGTSGLIAIFGILLGQIRRDRLFGLIPLEVVRPPRFGSAYRSKRVLHGLVTLLPLVIGLPYLILSVPLDTYRGAGGVRAVAGAGGSGRWAETMMELIRTIAGALVALLVLSFLYLAIGLLIRTVRDLVAIGLSSDDEPLARRVVDAAAPLLFVSAAAGIAVRAGERWHEAMTKGDGDALMVIERSLSLSNGISPLMPALIIGLVIAGWILLALYRHRCLESLPEVSDIAGVSSEAREPILCLRAAIDPVALHLRASWGWWLILLLIPIVFVRFFFVDLRGWPVRGFEGRSFEEATNLLLFVAVVLAISSGLSLLNGWRALRSLLARVERLRIQWPQTAMLNQELKDSYATAVDAPSEARKAAEAAMNDLKKVVDPLNAPGLAGKLDDAPLAVVWAKVFDWMLRQPSASNTQVPHPQAREFFSRSTALLVRETFLQLMHLRTFMTCCLLGLLVSLLSYPFEPERLLMLYVSGLVTAGAILSATILFQTRKSAAWNFLAPAESRTESLGDLSARLAFHAGLPALGLLAGRFPDLGGTLLQWIEQLTRPIG